MQLLLRIATVKGGSDGVSGWILREEDAAEEVQPDIGKENGAPKSPALRPGMEKLIDG